MRDVRAILPDGKIMLEGSSDEYQLMIDDKSGALGARKIKPADRAEQLDQFQEQASIPPAEQARIMAELGYD